MDGGTDNLVVHEQEKTFKCNDYEKILNDLINDRQRTPEEQRERYNQTFPETAKNMKVTTPTKIQ